MTERKRGTTLLDKHGQLWRVSNRGNAYPVNESGHRLGARFYMRLNYLENERGPLEVVVPGS